MRLTFPHMGLLSIPVETLLNSLGHEAVPAPPTNKRTFELGVKYSPEGACLPFKINLGNFIEALEQGAEGILMGGGVGPCRFGYYAQVQQRILADLGYKFELFLIEPLGGERRELYRTLRMLLANVPLTQAMAAFRLAWQKIRWVDQGNALLRYILPRSGDRVKAQRSYEHFLAAMRQEKKMEKFGDHYRELEQELRGNLRPETEPPLRVKIIGEIYMVLEPRVNFHLEMLLGEMGVEVVRTMSVSQWLEEHLFGFFYPHHRRRTVLLSAPFLPSFVGGHGRETIAEMVDAGVNGLDGVIQVLPFTCMPEIVAQSITPAVSAAYQLPILTLVLDEHSAEAGVLTRLEAFVDLLRRRRAQGKGARRVFSS
ncbi:MAG TPA: CoA protein activase [Firmicutes bacterium]|uniref:CoA protein activase n=1 Tax=Capillibacterium thermochitinicola TaxID=2699427 RepID=A0A8J6LSV1_9FIRM|nr:CoA protein activase [Capillibacterium thermochitinicola]MBA2133517.1 CoA protein activase [Capillibacterium thermochitinicola]HHW13104.1 CoA protein activase [Bacillota bacterium]